MTTSLIRVFHADDRTVKRNAKSGQFPTDNHVCDILSVVLWPWLTVEVEFAHSLRTRTTFGADVPGPEDGLTAESRNSR